MEAKKGASNPEIKSPDIFPDLQRFICTSKHSINDDDNMNKVDLVESNASSFSQQAQEPPNPHFKKYIVQYGKKTSPSSSSKKTTLVKNKAFFSSRTIKEKKLEANGFETFHGTPGVIDFETLLQGEQTVRLVLTPKVAR